MARNIQTIFHRAHEIAVVIYVAKFFGELLFGLHVA